MTSGIAIRPAVPELSHAPVCARARTSSVYKACFCTCERCAPIRSSVELKLGSFPSVGLAILAAIRENV